MTSGVEGRGVGRGGWLRVVAALAVLNLILVLPNAVGAVAPPALLRVAVELPALVLAMALLPAGGRAVLRWAATAALALLLLLKLADLASSAAFGRPFDAVADLHLVAAAWNLLSGSLGTVQAGMAVAGAVLLYGLVVLAAAWAVGVIAGAMGCRARRPAGMVAAVLLAGFFAVGAVAPDGGRDLPLTDLASRVAAGHAERLARSLTDLSEFRAAAARDDFRAVPDDRLLALLRDRDVLLVFVESYGRSALGDPRYAGTIRSTLERFGAVLEDKGAAAWSGWLTSPTVGGQSWLAHGTLLSGLWVDNQRRYDRLVAGGRQTLVHAFDRAGWRTVAAMPAITMPWPEGAFFGYDRLHAAADLGYAGKPFNWVTMPDQYTLSALRRLELDGRERPPVMAEIALISSHAPWTPVAPVIPWDAVGDGSVFSEWADSGDPPEVVWQDPARVRDQYRLALDYTLGTLAAYAEAYLDDRTVLIIVGDHQPAPLITGDGASRDVPIHIVAGDPALLAPLAGWGWTAGMVPDPAAPVWRMDAFRDRFLDAYTPTPGALAQRAAGPSVSSP